MTPHTSYTGATLCTALISLKKRAAVESDKISPICKRVCVRVCAFSMSAVRNCLFSDSEDDAWAAAHQLLTLFSRGGFFFVYVCGDFHLM